ncbi:unnamed protein product [Fusarium graminearum]|nr:unnamed protein product [Fusarium graminearum]
MPCHTHIHGYDLVLVNIGWMDGWMQCTSVVEITFRLTRLLLAALLFPAADESPGPSLPTNPLQTWRGLRDVCRQRGLRSPPFTVSV